MKEVLLIFLAILFSCNNEGFSGNLSVSTSSGQNKECVKHQRFGDISICFPEIDGLIECSSDSVVSYWSNVLKSEDEVTLGWYFNKNNYPITSTSLSAKLDYFKIFSRNNLINRKIQDGDFDEWENYMKSSEWAFLDDWDLAKKIKYINSIDVSGDKPIYIEVYTPPSNKTRSYVSLMKVMIEGREDIAVSILTIMEIQKRIIFYAYYLPYNGMSSINKAKAKSDYFGLKLLEFN